MRLNQDRSEFCIVSTCLAGSTRCPNCGDRLVAPEVSEYVESEEIRHHWLCEACGQPSQTAIRLISH